MNKLTNVLNAVKKDYGNGAVIMLNNSACLSTNIVPSGFLGIDKILGGGLPKGRMCEISGNEGVGKSTIALQFAANICKNGGECLFIDLENSTHIPYLSNLGVNEDNFAIAQPDSGTEALAILECALKEKVDIVILDSISALLTNQDIEADYGDGNFGTLAKLMSQSCRKLTPILAESGSILIWINQVRDKIGGYGTGNITTGGRAIRFYASQRLELSHIGQLKEGDVIVGSRVKIKTIKNKIAKPFMAVEENLYYGYGFCRCADLLDRAVETEIIQRSGSWYSFGDKKLGQGYEGVRSLLRSDESLFNDIVKKIGESSGV